MTPQEVVAALGDVQVATSYDDLVVDVPRQQWETVVSAARDDLDLTFFDFLTGVDLLNDGFEVVVRLWSVSARAGLQLRTRCPRADPTVASLSGVFAGADWHERQAAELFGLSFVGHPRLDPLLLPPGFEGHPLRKEFVLTARVDKVWPGGKEPGESAAEAAGRARRKHLPLGVPPVDRS